MNGNKNISFMYSIVFSNVTFILKYSVHVFIVYRATDVILNQMFQEDYMMMA